MDVLDILLATETVDKTSFLDMSYYSKEFSSWSRMTLGIMNPLGLAIALSGQNPGCGIEVVRKVLNAGYDVNSIVSKTSTQHNSGPLRVETVLLSAIQFGTTDLVELLIEQEAEVNKEAIFTVKQTPLQKAAQTGNLNMVKLLLKHGANVNSAAAVCGGGTALQFAAISGNCNIAAKLLRHGAELNTPPSKFYGRWPIEGAAEHGRIDMIEYLWKYSVCGFPDEQCRKAMRLAEENGHIACKELIQELMEDLKKPGVSFEF